MSRPEKGLTPGSCLKMTRELRKLSIPEVSKSSGISVEKIAGVESGQTDLTLEDFEKLAIALRTHPSFLAFPNWDHFEFRSAQQKLTGEFYINDRLDADIVLGSINSLGYLDLTSGKIRPSEKSIKIHPFTRFMPTGFGTVPDTKKDITYTFRGDHLGSASNVYSWGPDFEGESRTLKEVEIKIAHLSDGVHYAIDAYATAVGGYVFPSRPAGVPVDDWYPGDWTLRIRFVVPHTQLRDFGDYYSENAAIRAIEQLAKGKAQD